MEVLNSLKTIKFNSILCIPIFIAILALSGCKNSTHNEEAISELVQTSPDKKIYIMGTKNIGNDKLSIYVNAPNNVSLNFDPDKSDVGFIFSRQKNGGIENLNSGEYGSITSYLKKMNNSGYTFGYFPKGEKGTPGIIYGVESESVQKNMKIKGVNSNEELKIEHIDGRGMKFWYTLLPDNSLENYKITIGQGDVGSNVVNLNN